MASRTARILVALARPRASGALRGLVRWVPPTVPLVGRHAWQSADVYFRQQLAPAFMEAWDQDERGRSASSAGSPPGGPK